MNPLPDPNGLFLFTDGESPELPGYVVTEATGGLVFTGIVRVVGMTSLRERLPIPTLSERSLVGMALLLVLASIALFRLRAVRSRR